LVEPLHSKQVSRISATTDVDDALLERAAATGVDWRTLAAEQTELFRRDMESLGAPEHATPDGITESGGARDERVGQDLPYERSRQLANY